jgi:hypothetical protein
MGTRRSDLLDLSVKYPPSKERFTCAGPAQQPRRASILRYLQYLVVSTLFHRTRCTNL